MNVWTIRINRLVVQFASEALALSWKRPEGLSGRCYMFLAPRNPKHDFITQQIAEIRELQKTLQGA